MRVHRPMGIPKTGVFGLVDLVGLDLMPLVSKSHADDACRRTTISAACSSDQPLLTRMIAEGSTGRKGKGGFYPHGAPRRRSGCGRRSIWCTGDVPPG